MRSRPTLRGRLVASYTAVVMAVVVAGFVTIRLLTPALFHQRIQARAGTGGPGGPGSAGTLPAGVEDAYEEALTIALVVAAVIGLVVAVALATWLIRRLLGRFGDVQEASRRLAAGDYRHPIPEPEEEELADLVRSVNALGAGLAATDRTRAQLVSDLAHELRNPLATIEGYMEGLIDGVLPASADTYSTVAAEAHRLQRLTEDLSLLSKAQEGALALDLHPVDLAEVADRVTDRLRSQFEAAGVELSARLDDPLPVVVDPDRIGQALTNVIGNALGHTPAGGNVTVSGSRSQGRCRLTVTDTGAGIEPDQLEVIFSRFTRLDPQASGTGIGLNIARTIARLHEGDLTAHSRGPGAGATFTLVLPVAGGTERGR